MKKENYRSDLDFILPYPMWTEGEDGKPKMTDIGWPDFDWDVRLWTWNRSNAVVVSRHGDTLVNCFNDGGRIHVVLDNHNLGAGKLKADYHSMLPNAIYHDGIRDLFAPMELDVELEVGAGDCLTEVEVEAVLPVIKGAPFTYDDFTPEQIAELKRPATEAAETVNTLAEDERRAETLRVEAEDLREAAERKRVEAETERENNEQQRVVNEEERVKAEDERQEAERLREETFAGFENAIDSKADRSELSNIYAETPLSETNFPEIEQLTREQLKKDLFDDMWKSISGIKLDNGNYRMGADGKELTYEQAVLRYERDGFIRQYNEACVEKSSSGRVSALWGGYNEATGYFERYSATDKILDIGIDEARVMYDAYVSGGGYGNARANIPRHTFYNYMHYLTDPTRFTNTCLELVDEKYLSCYTGNTVGAVGCRILNSHDLRELRTIWLSTYSGNKVYIQSRNLEYIGFAQQNDPTPMPFSEFFIGNASKFRLDGIRVVVRYVRDSTVTVHKDVYAKLTGDTTNEAAAALTAEELEQWQQVFTDATAKNITFATT